MKCTLCFCFLRSPLISHIWSLCIVKEAMFIIVIGLWPIRLFISDLYISGTHNFLIYFYFTFFCQWEILCMVGSWEMQQCRWMVAVLFCFFPGKRWHSKQSTIVLFLSISFGKKRRKKNLEYWVSSLFIIKTIMTMMRKKIKIFISHLDVLCFMISSQPKTQLIYSNVFPQIYNRQHFHLKILI